MGQYQEYSLMSCSKKIQLKTLNIPFIFAAGLAFLSVTFLYAGDQIAEGKRDLKASRNVIQEYKESGDYATALRIARNSYNESLRVNLSRDAEEFSQVVKDLEERLLALGSSRSLFDENYQPRVKLLQLLELVGMEPLSKSEKVIIQINNWAQKNLLRQNERWQEQGSRFEELKPKIKSLLGELGFVDATFAHFKDYQGAIVHGALLPRVRLRLQYLVEQWKQGIRFPDIYFLSGERPLEVQQENKDTFMDDTGSLLKIRKDWAMPSEFPKTENEMIQLVWEQSEVPEDMREKVNVHFISAPMRMDSKSKRLIRPTTDDTVIAWLETAPPQGRYLAITNAPYTNRQDLVVRTIAPSEYGFDTIGSEAHEQETTAVFLDELARVIFQTKQLFEFNTKEKN